MKTIQQIKDEYAREHGRKDWLDYSNVLIPDNSDVNALMRRMAEEVKKEAKAQFDILNDKYPYKKSGDRDSYSEYRQGASDALDNAEQSILNIEIK